MRMSDMVKEAYMKVSDRMLFIWCLLGGLIFLLAPQALTSKFQLAFARLFGWPLKVGRDISLSASPCQAEDVVSRKKYIKLRNHLANTTQWLHQERRKVQKLAGLRERPVWEGANLVLADVITTFDRAQGSLVINRGKDDGIVKRQFVLSDASIIGTIANVHSRTAEVRLVTDPTSRIPIKIGQLDAGMILQGCGNCAGVRWLSKNYPVCVGDIVYVAKKPGFLDTPTIAGTIEQCKTDDENPLLWDITVKPACDITSVTQVAVIVMNPKE